MLGMYTQNTALVHALVPTFTYYYLSQVKLFTLLQRMCVVRLQRLFFFSGAETLRSIVKCSAQIPGEYSQTFAVVQSW